MLLEFDFDDEKKYVDDVELSDGTMKTILHLAAERYLHEVVKVILDFHPTLVDCTTEVGDDDWLPLYFALEFKPEENDTTSCCCNWVTNLCKKTDKEAEKILKEELKRKDETASMLIKAMEKEQ